LTGLDNILDVVGHHPLARVAVGLMAARALLTLWAWRRCRARLADGPPQETLEAIESRRQALWRHSARFLVIMLAGIGLAVIGLFRLAEAGDGAAPAFLMLALGMYLFMTEPARLQIADAEDRAAAAALGGEQEPQEVARAILRDAHVKLVLIEVSAALALALAILALGGGMPGMG
jgi:multisubunit Na+/H+ antiporter MnhB subunit